MLAFRFICKRSLAMTNAAIFCVPAIVKGAPLARRAAALDFPGAIHLLRRARVTINTAARFYTTLPPPANATLTCNARHRVAWW